MIPDQPTTPPPPPRRRGFDWRTALVPGLIGGGSIVAVFGTLGWLIATNENWPRIQRQFFNPDHMIAALPKVAEGFLTNMGVWLVAMAAIGVWALALAVIRSLRGAWFAPFRLMVMLYIDIFRGIPALLLVILFGFGILVLVMIWGIRRPSPCLGGSS